MSRFVYKQVISDKKFGATYLTVLGSCQNFSRMFVMKFSYFMIPKIGLKCLVWLYIGFNSFTVFVKREGYLQWLESKTAADFKIDMESKVGEKKKEN